MDINHNTLYWLLVCRNAYIMEVFVMLNRQIKRALEYRNAVRWSSLKITLIPEKTPWWKKMLKSLKSIL